MKNIPGREKKIDRYTYTDENKPNVLGGRVIKVEETGADI